MGMSWIKRSRPAAILALVFAVAPTLQAQSSATYRMDRVTVASAAESSSSLNYSIAVTFAQEGPVGSLSRCNDGFLQSTGFWSVLGEVPVPVLLHVSRDTVDPKQPSLVWSGSSSEFTIYRATMAQGLVDPFNETLVTSDCQAVDAPPPAAVTFYVVQPTGN